ncbi:MAG: hypothetical protein DLM52_02210 [Chthoniobacterales bacterium]|nr:MAG: hypothetical protein DLM52_02210 [Chthoniobacterales bacterium]
MKPHKLQTTVIVALCAFAASAAFARPIDYRELSLLVRAHESDSAIAQIASERTLLRPLTAQQEATLRSQGASDSLIRSLHNVALSPAEAAGAEAAPPPPAHVSDNGVSSRSPNIHIIDVGVEQPVNLSVWGGPDMEFAFRAPEIVESDRSEVEIIDSSSRVHYATYRGVRVPGWEPIDPQYTSIVSHSFLRPLHIDWRNPIQVNDVPYLLYPVYSTRGASLYFIGRMSDDVVRLAVVSP